MSDFDITIFNKTYHLIRTKVPKQDRYTIFQRCDNCLLDLIEGILTAGQLSKCQKLPILEKTSSKLSLTRVLIRLMKDTKSIDLKTYALFEENLDEIGRMLGGWIRSTKE